MRESSFRESLVNQRIINEQIKDKKIKDLENLVKEMSPTGHSLKIKELHRDVEMLQQSVQQLQEQLQKSYMRIAELTDKK